jgi:SAM dependent carboxyl methyltransferase
MEQKDTQAKPSAAKPMSENYNETVSTWTRQIINKSLPHI